VIDPRGGIDRVMGGAGADTITTSGDGARDIVSRGADLDVFSGDPFDKTWGDCDQPD
jgi:hypothetical protein